MPVRIGTGLSTSPDQRAGALEAALTAREGLAGEPCDLAVVFASGTHLAAPEAVLEAVGEALDPGALVGCAAGGVIAARREVEDGTAVSVWAAHLDGGMATMFHALVEEIEEGTGALAGMPELDGADGAILLADPATFPTDAVLRFLSESAPAVPSSTSRRAAITPPAAQPTSSPGARPSSTASSTASGAARWVPEANTTARSHGAPSSPSRALSVASSAPAR